MTRRFPRSFPNGFDLTLRDDALEIPLRWKRPRVIFVNSMSDLFHADVPETYVRSVFDVMRRTPHHVYQVLTKRAERLARLADRLPWQPNVWMGVSVESPEYSWRIDYLRNVSCRGAIHLGRTVTCATSPPRPLRHSLADCWRRESARLSYRRCQLVSGSSRSVQHVRRELLPQATRRSPFEARRRESPTGRTPVGFRCPVLRPVLLEDIFDDLCTRCVVTCEE